MTTAEALQSISKALAVLAHQTQVENYAGLFSRNRIAEDILLPIARLALNAPRLKNANLVEPNAASIDLADGTARLAVQVTSETNAAKIADTLRQFTALSHHRRYRRLCFILLAATQPRYSPIAKAKWARITRRKITFDASTDILAIPKLFRVIQGLPQRKIFIIQRLLSESVLGEEFVDVADYLSRQSRRQIDAEKKWGKYIPEVFVETRQTKTLARTFAHPRLFLGRTIESLGRVNFGGMNRILARSGLPPIPPVELDSNIGESVDEAVAVATALAKQLTQLSEYLLRYEKLKYKDPPPFKIPEANRPYYEENVFNLQMAVGWGLRHTLEQLHNEAMAARSRIFILTGSAGQGKTNFVCDFVERFLAPHGVPCAYLTGRRISAVHSPDLADTVQRLIFDGRTTSFAEAARLLGAHAERTRRPFVLVIDGLNEHHVIHEFSDQMQHFAEAIIEYPNLRLLLTCRSEFFARRFGKLTGGVLKEHTFLLESNERRLEQESYALMVRGYFKFFGIDGRRVSGNVVKSLKRDTLLLRFFCEAYGARGKPGDYRQPVVRNIYRDQIFDIYLREKLGTANAFFERVTGRVSPVDPKAELRLVLARVLAHMLDSWRFADVPVSIIPGELHQGLYALLDEELILRRDAAVNDALFAPSQETINFTFDEFRDFLLAQYLLQHVYATDKASFEAHVSRKKNDDTQSLEGVKKFLFYASRQPTNAAFLAYYRELPWYGDVYDREIFNIDGQLLRAEDAAIATSALAAGDERAQWFATQLAVCWDTSDYPVLNLDLLLSFLKTSSDVDFDTLVVGAFEPVRYHNDGTSSSAFCGFVLKSILPTFDPEKERFAPLFTFLIMLFPINAGPNLDSEAVLVFRELARRYPAYAVDLLTASLALEPTRHVPYVWRLLSSLSEASKSDDDLRRLAQQTVLTTHNETIRREATRFLERTTSTSEETRR